MWRAGRQEKWEKNRTLKEQVPSAGSGQGAAPGNDEKRWREEKQLVVGAQGS